MRQRSYLQSQYGLMPYFAGTQCSFGNGSGLSKNAADMPVKPGKIVGNLLAALFVTQAMDALARFLILGRNKGGVPIVNVVRLSGVSSASSCDTVHWP